VLNVHWRTGVGYGDFVTGLGYAHTTSIKYQTPVHIKFFWEHSEDYLFSPDDPETIVDRCHYIQKVMRSNPMVEVSHVYNKRLEYRFLNQFDEFNPLHGLWYSDLPQSTSRNVVLWSSRFNKSYPGKSKDPAIHHWDRIIKKIENHGYTVTEVTYRTSVKEVVSLVQYCAFGIGYDGLIHQIYKFMWKPVIVLCERIGLNKLLIPQASLVADPEKFLMTDLNYYIKDSENKIIDLKKQHQRYMNEHAIANEHRLYNTPIG
jgi:hypothetical protein